MEDCKVIPRPGYIIQFPNIMLRKKKTLDHCALNFFIHCSIQCVFKYKLKRQQSLVHKLPV